jgi:hypothetical protein
MLLHLDRFVDAVQTNCHISDARHARNLTLCTYLLEMREFYRWEQGILPSAPLSRADVGAWLAGREALWETVEQAPYRPLPLPLTEGTSDPFDVRTINAALVPHGLVYGAGVGRFGKPQFFLGALEREEWRNGIRVLVAGCEYARDLSPAPAALRDGTIYVRLESLQRWLWEKVEAWAQKRSDGALKCALDGYGFADGRNSALAQMAAAEAETLILHELGEHEAGRLLGPAWETMLSCLTRRRAELFARAARDHLADCLVTLPALLEREATASVHFWFANLDGLRRERFPQAADAYAAWCRGDRGHALRDAAASGVGHWHGVCAQVMAMHAQRGAEAEAAIETLSAAADTQLRSGASPIPARPQ